MIDLTISIPYVAIELCNEQRENAFCDICQLNCSVVVSCEHFNLPASGGNLKTKFGSILNSQIRAIHSCCDGCLNLAVAIDFLQCHLEERLNKLVEVFEKNRETTETPVDFVTIPTTSTEIHVDGGKFFYQKASLWINQSIFIPNRISYGFTGAVCKPTYSC
jgi:hypothetical protein